MLAITLDIPDIEMKFRSGQSCWLVSLRGKEESMQLLNRAIFAVECNDLSYQEFFRIVRSETSGDSPLPTMVVCRFRLCLDLLEDLLGGEGASFEAESRYVDLISALFQHMHDVLVEGQSTS